MRELLSTWDASYLANVRVMLDAEHIPFCIFPEDGQFVPDTPWRVMLLRADDYDDARTALATVDRSSVTPAGDWPKRGAKPYAFYALVTLTGLAFVAAIAIELWRQWRA